MSRNYELTTVQSIEGGNTVVDQNSLGDMRTPQLVQIWLSIDAPHVDYQRCCEVAKAGFECGIQLVLFHCRKCGAVCCDPIEHVMKPQVQHRCIICGHKLSKYPLV